MLVIFLIIDSLLILAVTFLSWRATSSRSALMGGLFASVTMLYAARLVSAHQQPEMAVGLPLLAGMLLLGRGIGTAMRVKREPDLRPAAIMWLGAAVMALIGAAAVYRNMLY